MPDKDEWLRMWNYTPGTFAAEAAWAAKLAFKPHRSRILIGGSVDYSYACPVTGDVIASKTQHEENLKRQDCRLLEPGETAANTKSRQREEAELDRKIEETVEKEITSWDSDKREKLGNELSQGVDVIVERK